MLAYVLRRLWQMIPTMAGVVLLVFLLFNWVGGDPAFILAGKMANAEEIANMTGVNRQTASRILGEFRRDGLLSIDHRRIRIESEKRLAGVTRRPP